MFERFTDRARSVLAEARAEAVESGVGYIGTEHLLIGMVREGTGVAAVVLAEHGITLGPVRERVQAELGTEGRVRIDHAAALATLGIDLAAVRSAVEAAFGQGALVDPATNPPFTPRARHSLELALATSLRWRHRYIGTEHLLAGVIGESEGLAASVLSGLGAQLGELTDDAKKIAAPETRRADQAWDAFIVLMRQLWELPDTSLRDELASAREGGFGAVFGAAAEEQSAINAASERFAERVEELNRRMAERLSEAS